MAVISVLVCGFIQATALAGTGMATGKAELTTVSSRAMSYTVTVPNDWFGEITLTNENKPAHVILEQSRFTSDKGAEITISVWNRASFGSLQNWLDENSQMLSLFDREVSDVKAGAAGVDGKSYTFDNTGGHAYDQIKTYFQLGAQVFEVAYYMADGGQSKDQYLALIDSLTSGVTGERDLLPTALAGERPENSNRVYSCGGYNDDCYCAAWNPFPCCSNGGNCTWWAWHMACCNWGVDVPPRGNANTWAGTFAAYGYSVYSSPAVGRIACRNSGTYGHVAYVTGVSGDYVTVSEMNCWGGYGARTWTYHKSYFDGGYVR